MKSPRACFWPDHGSGLSPTVLITCRRTSPSDYHETLLEGDESRRDETSIFFERLSMVSRCLPEPVLAMSLVGQLLVTLNQAGWALYSCQNRAETQKETTLNLSTSWGFRTQTTGARAHSSGPELYES